MHLKNELIQLLCLANLIFFYLKKKNKNLITLLRKEIF